MKKNGDKYIGIQRDNKEYTGIYYINKNGNIYERNIEKGKDKEKEILINITKEDLNKYTQFINYNDDDYFDEVHEEKQREQMEERRKI